jgi:hypothetical protein
MGVTRLHVTIDDLVLVGFDPLDRYGIADAIERELTRRLAGADVAQLTSGEARPSLHAADVRRSGSASRVGTDVGASVATALVGKR